MPSVSPARAAAFDILLRVERESSYTSELLHSGTYEGLSRPDHALATQLVMGVLRWRSKLDDEIARASSQPLKKLDMEILIALRLAVYQFRWLDRVPQRAALHESVELVKRARKRSAAPFANAVLRKIAQFRPDPKPPLGEFDSADSLAAGTAHPLWLVERWVKEYGFEAANQICAYDQIVPTTSLRLRSADAENQVTQDGIALSRGRLVVCARCVESVEITRSQAFRKGSVVIQDEASQLVAALTVHAAKAGDRILDCCAAPGGKTLAMSDQNPKSSIIAVEAYRHRARRMKDLLLRSSTTSSALIQIVAADARALPLTGSFDRVLADVPCSGTGTLARNPEIKWRLRPEDLADLHQRQVQILNSALRQVAAGGRLVYSTCSLEREENEDVVQEVLSQDNRLRVAEAMSELEKMKAAGKLLWPDLKSLTRGPYLRTIPGVHPCDGFFAAILEWT